MVKVVYLPDTPDGAKQGVDDFFAAGGTPAQLRALSTLFDPKTLRRVRLSRDERLSSAIAELWRIREAMPRVTRGQNTRCSVARAVIEAARLSGKVVDKGVEVTRSIRQIAVDAAISYRSAYNALLALEESGFLRRVKDGRKKDAPGSFILLVATPSLGGRALGNHNGKGEALKEKVSQEYNIEHHSDYLMRIPQNLDTFAADDRDDYLARAPEEVPELRWGYVEKHPATMKVGIDGKAMRTVEYEYRARLGKKRGGIVEALVKNDGSAYVSQLMEDFAGARTRPRDFIRRNIAPLAEAGIVALTDDTVSLTADWREALENARTLGGEQLQAKLQQERYRRQSKAYRNRHKVKPEPVPEAPHIDDFSKPWAHHPEGCACRECEARFGKVIGEHGTECYCGECKARRDHKSPQPRRRHLYVVANLDPELETVPYDWRSHPLDCDCLDCVSPPPKYARVKEMT